MYELRKSFLRNGSHYTLHGDYYFPDFTDPEDCGSLGKQAEPYLPFLKEYQPHAYVEMLFADKLVPYLRDFQTQAETWYQRLVEQMQRAEGVTEKLKARDPMAWGGRMNGIAARARKIVMEEWGNR